MAVGTAAAIVGGAIIAGGAYSAYSQAKGGQQQAKSIERQAAFNAEVYEQQASMIQEKKKIQDTQYLRAASRMRGSITASAAGKGFLMSGSPLAILIDSESQLQFDKAIDDYNLDVERNFALSGATATRFAGQEQARLSRATGYSNAFSTLLNTAGTVFSRG